ncbi:MAG: hypothetical protein ABI585_07530 [Betaproteobacteria bacterium]
MIDNPQTARARALLERDPDWHSDACCLVELTNALATAMQVRRMALYVATSALAEAQSVIEDGLQSTGHATALATSSEFRISAYDARMSPLGSSWAPDGSPRTPGCARLRRCTRSHWPRPSRQRDLVARPTKRAYDPTDTERRDLTQLIAEGRPVPENHRFILFEDESRRGSSWPTSSRSTLSFDRGSSPQANVLR